MDAPVLSRDEEMQPNQLPEDVESYIKQYFDVSTEQIRKSRHFDSKIRSIIFGESAVCSPPA